MVSSFRRSQSWHKWSPAFFLVLHKSALVPGRGQGASGKGRVPGREGRVPGGEGRVHVSCDCALCLALPRGNSLYCNSLTQLAGCGDGVSHMGGFRAFAFHGKNYIDYVQGEEFGEVRCGVFGGVLDPMGLDRTGVHPTRLDP